MAVTCVYLINKCFIFLVGEPIVVHLVKILFWNQKVYSHVDKRPVHIPTLSQMKPVYSITSISLKLLATSFHQCLGLPSSSLGVSWSHFVFISYVSMCILHAIPVPFFMSWSLIFGDINSLLCWIFFDKN